MLTSFAAPRGARRPSRPCGQTRPHVLCSLPPEGALSALRAAVRALRTADEILRTLAAHDGRSRARYRGPVRPADHGRARGRGCPSRPPRPSPGSSSRRIEQVDPHPNADRLRVCLVDVGAAERLRIVCGAPNAAAGMKVPCATVGAQLPGGLRIAAATMRGVESQGMLCSASELGIDADASGLLALPADAAVGRRPARRARPRRRADHAQDHAEPRRLPVDPRHRARRRGGHRRGARAARRCRRRRSTSRAERAVRVEDADRLPSLRVARHRRRSTPRRRRRRG